MTMPETAIYKDNCSVFWQNDISRRLQKVVIENKDFEKLYCPKCKQESLIEAKIYNINNRHQRAGRTDTEPMKTRVKPYFRRFFYIKWKIAMETIYKHDGEGII